MDKFRYVKLYSEDMVKVLNYFRNEYGMVLITALVFIAILGLMGATAMMTTSTELMISRNYKTAKVAFYAAEAGIEEARARLRGLPSDANYVGDPYTSPDPLWSAYILTSNAWQTSDDPNYNTSYYNYIPTLASNTNTSIAVNSLQTDISYFVKIRHKREYDAEEAGHTTSSPHYYDNDGSTAIHSASAPGNIIYYGYGDPGSPTAEAQFTAPGSTEHKPVEIITAYGRHGKSSTVIKVEVVQDPGPRIVSPLYAKDKVTVNGAFTADGNDSCASGVPKPPIYTLDPAITSPPSGPSMELSGSPMTPQTGSIDIDIAYWVDRMKGSATEIITADQQNTVYGSPDDFVTCYSDTSNPTNNQGLRMNNVKGYGILLVDGDLMLAGNFDWSGLLLITGTLTVSGGGGLKNVFGAVLANQTVDINGGIEIYYNSCMINNSFNNMAIRLISWKQVN